MKKQVKIYEGSIITPFMKEDDFSCNMSFIYSKTPSFFFQELHSNFVEVLPAK